MKMPPPEVRGARETSREQAYLLWPFAFPLPFPPAFPFPPPFPLPLPFPLLGVARSLVGAES